MSDIHVHTAEGEQFVDSELRIAELLESGEISPLTLYWREGMEKWEPLSTFKPSVSRTVVPVRPTEALPQLEARPLPPAAAIPAQPSDTRHHSKRFRFRRNPEPLTTIVMVLLILCICAAGLELANALIHYSSISTPDLSPPAPEAPTPPGPDVLDDTGWLLFWVSVAVNTLMLVPYCMWVYRANSNSRNFSLIVRFHANWAVGCHFVPIINCFQPCQVMQEIYKVSRNPRTWHNDGPSVLVGIWWAFALATAGLGASAGLLGWQAQSDTEIIRAALLLVILFAVQIVFYALFIAVIYTIVQKQTRLVNASKRRNPPPPAPAPTP